jgi:hypothetical protein
MADIFGRANSGMGGAFTSALAQINLAGSGLANKMLLSNISADYAQNVQRIFELESDKAYFVVGRPQGTGQIRAVFGPKAASQAAYADLANPCLAHNIVFQSSDATCVPGSTGMSGGDWTRSINNVILNSINFAVDAQDMLINENLGFVFASMSVA